jgi:hypothetical protein
MDAQGIETLIAGQSAKILWSTIRSVADEGDCIVFVRENGNAFIIPPRAFATVRARLDFLAFARKSVTGATGTA